MKKSEKNRNRERYISTEITRDRKIDKQNNLEDRERIKGRDNRERE